MRIAILAPEVFPVPPVKGGAIETVIEAVASRLAASGMHEVHVLGVADPSLPLIQTRGQRTDHRWKPGLLDRLLLASWKLPFKQSGSRWYYWPYSRWAARRLQMLQPDVVWAHSRMPFVPHLRAALPNVPILLSLHQVSSLQGAGVWTDKHIQMCDRIVGPSTFLTEAAALRYPAARGRLAVLPNGVDAAQFQPWWKRAEARQRIRDAWGMGDGPVVVYAGRLVEQKGVDLLAEAFARTAAQWPDSRLLLIGGHGYSDHQTTPYIERLKSILQSVAKQVVWAGYVEPGQLPDLYASGDLAVVPSTGPEAFSLVTLEAMACGLPVVALAHGGPVELIEDKRTGMLVDPALGSMGISEALSIFFSDAALRERLGRRARQAVEGQWTWDNVAAQVVTLSEQVVAERHADGAHMKTESRKPGRIKVLLAESGSGYGGSAKYLRDLVSLLDRRRFQVRVAAAQNGPFIKDIKRRNVPVLLRPGWRFPWNAETARGGERRAVAREPRRSRLGAYGWTFLSLAVQVPLASPAIAWWLRSHGYQVVHLNNEVLSHVPLLIGAKLAGCRVVCHLHGWRLLTRLERAVIGLVDELVCISKAGARYYSGQLAGRWVTPVPNGLVLDGQPSGGASARAQARRQLGVPANATVAAMLGRLVPWKGHLVYLQALAAAIRRAPGLMGVIVGHDPSPDQAYLRELKATAHELGIAARVVFADWQKDVSSVYAAADIVVHASTAPEPFGLVLIEAMAAGRPVIATRAGGVVDIVQDGESGLLVEPGNAQELAEAMARLSADRDLAGRMSRHAQARVQAEFTMERNAEQIMSVYSRLGDARARRPART